MKPTSILVLAIAATDFEGTRMVASVEAIAADADLDSLVREIEPSLAFEVTAPDESHFGRTIELTPLDVAGNALEHWQPTSAKNTHASLTRA